MSREAKPKRRRLWAAAAAGGALVSTAAAVGIGPGAAWVVDTFADGQRVWRLGDIEIDGVSGVWLGDLRAARARIADANGVWLEAEDVALRWRPFDVFGGAVRIDATDAARIRILRRPALSEPRASRARFDVRIDEARIDALDLSEGVSGPAASFAATLTLDVREQSLTLLDLSLDRTDSDADRLAASYRSGDAFAFQLDASGQPGGVFAHALGQPDRTVRAFGAGSGDASSGNAELEAQVGEAPVLAGSLRWTTADWALNAHAELTPIPALAALARRIGETTDLEASGARAGVFTLHAATPHITLDANGQLDEEQRLVGGARFTAVTERLSDIIREVPFEFGHAQLEGEFRNARGTAAIEATLNAQQIEALGARTRLAGPVRAALTRERFTLEGDLRAPAETSSLFANAQLSAALEHDRRRGRFELKRAVLRGDTLAVDAQGWVADGDGEFSGEWRVHRLDALPLSLSGQAEGHWRAWADDEDDARIWTTSVQGDGARIASNQSIVEQLLGAAPHLEGRFISENGGTTVSYLTLNGARLRAGARGRIVRGQANLALEASARGPLALGEAQLTGAADATGSLTGRLARPSLAMQASFASIEAGGASIARPQIDVTLAPEANAYVGRAELRGAMFDQPLTAASEIMIDDGQVRLPTLSASLANLRGAGQATLTDRGLSATLAISGALDGLAPNITGGIGGATTLTPDGVQIDATLTHARAGELYARSASVHAEGPYDAIAARFDMRGRLREAPLTFAGSAALNDEGRALAIEGRGALAGADIFTRAPISLGFGRQTLEAAFNVALGDGVATGAWRERGRAFTASAVLTDAPLAPIAAIWGERAEGLIDGQMSLGSAGNGLRGDADIMLNDARFAGRQRGRLNARIRADLDPHLLRATFNATSTDGLVANATLEAPVITEAAPLRVARAQDREGRATWSLQGPADTLWAAARLPDQSLEGPVQGEGALTFGAGALTGEGHIEIVDGRFEDKLTGVALTDLDARLALDPRGVTIERFSARDAEGGQLTATGGSSSARDGRITVAVNNVRVANRPDARARASGELTLAWEDGHSTLSGDLNILEANLDVAARPDAGIPVIDVVEINRPDQEDGNARPMPPSRNGSTVLDVRIRAPGRVFTRGRGLDAELSLDLTLNGTACNPRLYGEARTVRGSLALSGQPFEIDDARITFDGDPLDAQIDLAATRATADLTATIRLAGTARDPEVSFSSDPGLPEDEILPQVLFGRSVEDLSAFEAAQLAASLAALSGQASLDLVDAARAAAGLDRFNVRQDEDGGFLVAGGIYLTREVYVEVARTGLGQAQSRVEWTVRPRLVLITSFLGNGDQSVSLRWRRESD
jgi:translocation and assembly module TamB